MSFINVILTILAMILVLGPLVALHEWGHYIVARLCGVKVITYSIGFGKELWSWTSPKTGIKYCISALPLGGYVKMLDGREGEVAEDEKHLAFDTQHPLKKIAIVLAGPAMNFIIAIVLFWVLFITPSEQFNTRIGSIIPDSYAETAGLQIGDKIVAIDDMPVASWEEISYKLADRMGETATIKVTVEPYHKTDSTEGNTKDSKVESTDYTIAVDNFMQGTDKGKMSITILGFTRWQPTITPIVVEELVADGAGIKQGMLVGDTILSVDDKAMTDWFDFQRIVMANPEKSLDIKVLRDDKEVVLDVMPRGYKDKYKNEYGMIGIKPKVANYEVPDNYKTTIIYAPFEAIGKSIDKTANLSYMTVKSMGKMLVGMIGLDNLSGPISIAQIAKQSFDISWQMVVSTAGMISVSLAVLNLLPIPVLDGGHFMLYLIELIRGKPVSEKAQIISFNIGFLLMLAVMLLAIGMDVSRFF